jgi:hypothetical protein
MHTSNSKKYYNIPNPSKAYISYKQTPPPFPVLEELELTLSVINYSVIYPSISMYINARGQKNAQFSKRDTGDGHY